MIALAALALFAATSAASLAIGFVLYFHDRPNPVTAFRLRGAPVTRDAAFGFVGMAGCFGCAVALFGIAVGRML